MPSVSSLSGSSTSYTEGRKAFTKRPVWIAKGVKITTCALAVAALISGVVFLAIVIPYLFPSRVANFLASLGLSYSYVGISCVVSVIGALAGVVFLWKEKKNDLPDDDDEASCSRGSSSAASSFASGSNLSSSTSSTFSKSSSASTTPFPLTTKSADALADALNHFS